jgi:hypothetical protein
LRNSIVALVSLSICLVWSVPSARAQQAASPLGNRVAFARAGFFFGRTGAAIGSSGYLEINPSRWLGVCAFASQSRAAAVAEGGRAQSWGFSTGACLTAHLPEVKGFLISPFVQMTYENNHNRIVIPLGNGAFYRDGDNRQRRLWLVGPAVDRAIVKNGPRWAVRVAKNFGKGPTVQNAAGLYVVGGVIFPLDHPVELGRSFRRMFGWKPPADAPSPAHP